MFSSKDASAFVEKKNKNRDTAQQKSGERAEKRRRVMVRVANIFLVYLIRFVRGLARVVMSLVRKESRISLILSQVLKSEARSILYKILLLTLLLLLILLLLALELPRLAFEETKSRC